MTHPTDLHTKISEILNSVGFEVYPFLIGWYNDLVQEIFKLPYDRDILAFVVLSTPAMFDKAFKPFICRQSCEGPADPIDECMRYHFSLIKEALPDKEVDVIYDFDMTPTRRPKILVQTAGHVAGAAYYYQKRDVTDEAWYPNKKMSGVSIHPKYGGWFALRGVFIFKSIHQPDLPHREPVDCLPSQENRKMLLETFNFNCQDWSYRDIMVPDERYSDEQKKYFQTHPQERKDVLKEILANCVRKEKN